MHHPIICFGQQPCGFFPKRFLFAKILTARRLQNEIGGDIVFFFHDSDHDPRETITILRDQHSNEEVALNFQFENRIQKQFSPLYVKRVVPELKEKSFAHAIATGNCCCTKEAIASWRSPEKILARSKLVRPATRVLSGCNQSFDAPITSPERASSITSTRQMLPR